MTATTAHLDLAIDIGSDPITGSLTVPGREPRRFQGWIELTEAIEAARRRSEIDETARRRQPAGASGVKRLGYFPGAKPGWV